MAVRKPINKELLARATERLDKMLARIYLLWLVGEIIGVIGLRADKVKLGVLDYTIDKPEALQGLIFIVCILYYFAVFGIVVGVGIETEFSQHGLMRRMVYGATGSRRTLTRLSRVQIIATKK